jgi:uncharacterized membrane protein YkvA (DUF1232 family)
MTLLRKLWRLANRRQLLVHLAALWKLFRHPATPRPAKWVALAVLVYAISPIDLVPDFIPLLGQIDDLIILPLGLSVAMRLAPPGLWQAQLADARAHPDQVQRLARRAWWVLMGLIALSVTLLVAVIVGLVRSFG